MFTGLVESLGRVVEVEPRRGSTRVAIASDLPLEKIRVGESISVDGVCLTVAAIGGGRFYADVVAETLVHTTLSCLEPGDRVNLERALRVGDRLGGHLLQGHVDTTAPVLEVQRHGDDYRLRVESDPSIRRFIARKGSVALQGVSLTVATVEPEFFAVALVPETLARTTLSNLRPGDRVNVEVDLLARYLETLLGEGFPRESQGTDHC